MLTIFFGDCDTTVADQARAVDKDAFLVDRSNVLDLIDNLPTKPTSIYTSLADLPKDLTVVYKLLGCADIVIYCPPQKWSDSKLVDVNDPTASVQGLTEFVLNQVNKEKANVKNLDLFNYSIDNYAKLASSRKTNNPQLWVVGCSNSHATGVDNNQRYGQLVADHLNVPVSFLTCPGSSIQWATDQILRSDLRADDIVIWGLTDESRFPIWTEKNELAHINTNYIENTTTLSSRTLNQLLVHPTNFYQAIIHVLQVLNFCKKAQAKLLIFGLGVSDSLSIHLHAIPEFINFLNKESNSRYIDVGTDNQHPGPKQHKEFADICINRLKALNYI